MEYTYFLEDIGNKNLEKKDLDDNVFYILCYYIDNQGKYPFIQFMMEKIPFCNNLIKEQLVLPHININNSTKNIEESALEKVKNSLHTISNNITNDMYKGMVWCNNWYILINISNINININGQRLSRNASNWFVLPTEIINTKEVCGIDIDSDITYLFTQNPKLSILTNPKTNDIFILPDAVYTSDNYNSVKFNAIFGNKKTKIYKSCGEYFYFYRTYLNALKYGLNDGINRYALFLEGELYMELDTEFSLSDIQIKKMYPEPCIQICYLNVDAIKPDILVKDYDNCISLSYHIMNNEKLDMH